MKFILGGLFTAVVICLYISTSAVFLGSLSGCNASPVSSSSSVSPVVGSWQLTLNIGGVGISADQVTFYPDGVMSDSTGSGTWSVSGTTGFVATFIAGTNSNMSITGSVSNNNASGRTQNPT